MFQFEDGILKTDAYVEIDGKRYPVVMPEYEGKTPITAKNLNSFIMVSAKQPESNVWIQHSINMLKVNVANFSAYGVTGTNKEDGSILVSGNATSSNVYLIGLKRINKDNISLGDYTLSINNAEAMPDVSIRLRKISTSGSKTEITTQVLDTINKEISLNSSNLVGSDTSYIELDLYLKTQKQYDFTIYPQFQRGKATDYETPVEDEIFVSDNGIYVPISNKIAIIEGEMQLTANTQENLQNNIVKLTNTSINYPSDFNWQNSVVIATGAINKDYFSTKGYSFGDVFSSNSFAQGQQSGAVSRSVDLQPEKILLTLGNFSTSAVTYKYKIVLMKIY